MPEREIIDETKPWVVIPYFKGDMGRKGIERDPLPAPAIWYLCPGVRIAGGPLRVYTPGAPTAVDIDVWNYGGGAAVIPVEVTVWWSDPTVGFGSAKWFASAQTTVTSKGGSKTVTVTGTIPVGAPSHVCLLVSVEAAFNDNLPAVIGPGTDRHWAQLNIDAVAAPDGGFVKQFHVGNPADRRVRVHVRAQFMSDERLEAVRDALGMHLFRPEAGELKLLSATGEDPPEQFEGAVPVDLDAGGSVTMELRGEVTPAPTPGTAAFIEIVQYAPHDPDAVIGALGLVVASE
jgi:hypothetical protein